MKITPMLPFFCMYRQRTRNAVGENFSVDNFEAIIIDIHV